MEMIKIGDYVRYIHGSCVYRVTHHWPRNIKVQSVKTGVYYVEDPSKFCKINTFSLGENIAPLENGVFGCITSIEYKDDEVIYHLNLSSGSKVVYKESELLLLKYNENGTENRLQEQTRSESGRDDSRVSEQLCCRNRISYQCGYRGNKYSFNQSKEYLKGLYDKLSLGQQSLS